MTSSLYRTPHERRARTTVLIVGEGKNTEAYYFDGLKREVAVQRPFAVTVKKGPGYTPEAVVREAVNQKKGAAQRGEEYDEVWCVLDVEGTDKRESLDAAVKLAEENDIRLCLSNPAFEVWFLAHFLRTCKSFLHARAVIDELNRPWREHCGRDYDKDDDRVYQRVADLTGTALQNAWAVRETDHRGLANTANANSSTEVYRLVGRLLGR